MSTKKTSKPLSVAEKLAKQEAELAILKKKIADAAAAKAELENEVGDTVNGGDDDGNDNGDNDDDAGGDDDGDDEGGDDEDGEDTDDKPIKGKKTSKKSSQPKNKPKKGKKAAATSAAKEKTKPAGRTAKAEIEEQRKSKADEWEEFRVSQRRAVYELQFELGHILNVKADEWPWVFHACDNTIAGVTAYAMHTKHRKPIERDDDGNVIPNEDGEVVIDDPHVFEGPPTEICVKLSDLAERKSDFSAAFFRGMGHMWMSPDKKKQLLEFIRCVKDNHADGEHAVSVYISITRLTEFLALYGRQIDTANRKADPDGEFSMLGTFGWLGPLSFVHSIQKEAAMILKDEISEYMEDCDNIRSGDTLLSDGEEIAYETVKQTVIDSQIGYADRVKEEAKTAEEDAAKAEAESDSAKPSKKKVDKTKPTAKKPAVSAVVDGKDEKKKPAATTSAAATTAVVPPRKVIPKKPAAAVPSEPAAVVAPPEKKAGGTKRKADEIEKQEKPKPAEQKSDGKVITTVKPSKPLTTAEPSDSSATKRAKTVSTNEILSKTCELLKKAAEPVPSAKPKPAAAVAPTTATAETTVVPQPRKLPSKLFTSSKTATATVAVPPPPPPPPTKSPVKAQFKAPAAAPAPAPSQSKLVAKAVANGTSPSKPPKPTTVVAAAPPPPPPLPPVIEQQQPSPVAEEKMADATETVVPPAVSTAADNATVVVPDTPETQAPTDDTDKPQMQFEPDSTTATAVVAETPKAADAPAEVAPVMEDESFPTNS